MNVLDILLNILGALMQIVTFGVLMLAGCFVAIFIGGAAYAAGKLTLEKIREKKGD